MKKLLIGFVAAFALLLVNTPASAVAPNWVLTAPSAIEFTCGGGNYPHTLDTVINEINGDFSGTGSYDNGPHTWDINGDVDGDNITFTVVYTGANAGYTLNGTGTVAPDGSISGTTDGNCQTFEMPAGTAEVVEDLTLNWGTEVNPGMCDPHGKLAINVTHKVVNSIDSGEGGNYWAYSNYNRHIQLWNQGDSTYCAVVQYEGKVMPEVGQTSPGAGGTLDGDENATFQGGYRATITGDLNTNPGYKTKGNLGVFDYDCDISGTCASAWNWVDEYFNSGYSFGYDWWGWIYHAGSHGIWVNSSDGNAGDIL